MVNFKLCHVSPNELRTLERRDEVVGLFARLDGDLRPVPVQGGDAVSLLGARVPGVEAGRAAERKRVHICIGGRADVEELSGYAAVSADEAGRGARAPPDRR